ncbi:MAG TPA: Stk1 family PASTA domain-containing Ser/Thr kinase [Clostridiales bacterium]|nr:Stk1 family PASTA domain-containing Ser/Thr kinase [Clostridiales bacterium]
MNRYQIVTKLGSGGTAVVYKAIDTVLNREVTVKILQEQFTTNQKFVLRFRKEAQAIAALSHPNIVSVYDVGTSDDGEQYLIMEYVEGKTLKEVIKKKGILSLDRALDYTNQILAGLNHAHSFGVIHRDIKPQNIMITPNGQVKIMDFGLAMNLTDTTITYDTSVFGSVYYIAPEIAQKGSGDARVDIYSVGIVLYEMLTGELPYTGDSPIAIALQHVEGDYTPIDEIDEEIPYEVARIVDKAMAVNPVNRYGSAKIMMDDIQTAADEYDVILTPIQVTTAATAAAAAAARRGNATYDTYEEDYEEVRSRRKDSGGKKKKKDGAEKSNKKLVAAIILIATAIILLSVGAFALIRNMSDAKEVEVPDVVGLTEAEAINDLEELNLQYKITEEETDEYDPGIVIQQSIDAGTKVKEGKVIELTVSVASDELEVPDVTGQTQDKATLALENAGFKVEVQEESSDSVEAGKVIRQSPSGGRKLAKDETVIIIVSTGKEDVTVPSLIGLTKEDAIAKLSSAGLKYSITSYEYSTSYASGYVIYQNYSSGEAVAPDTVINIKISKGPEPTPDPTPTPDPGTGDNPADEEEKE